MGFTFGVRNTDLIREAGIMNNSEELTQFLEEYNNCFLQKDINKLRQFYSRENDELIYFDNHKDNDTFSVDEHLELVTNFFKHGKETESTQVEEISMEKIHCFGKGDSACICFYARYKSFPTPAVRSTLYLEKSHNEWKIKHAHYSFEPAR